MSPTHSRPKPLVGLNQKMDYKRKLLRLRTMKLVINGLRRMMPPGPALDEVIQLVKSDYKKNWFSRRSTPRTYRSILKIKRQRQDQQTATQSVRSRSVPQPTGRPVTNQPINIPVDRPMIHRTPGYQLSNWVVEGADGTTIYGTTRITMNR